MIWRIDGAPADETFDSEGEAIAAAWARTRPGQMRPAVAPGTGVPRADTESALRWLTVEIPPQDEWRTLVTVQAWAYVGDLPDVLRPSARDLSALSGRVSRRMLLREVVQAAMAKEIKKRTGKSLQTFGFCVADSEEMNAVMMGRAADTDVLTYTQKFYTGLMP